jgi:hypothetical protein
MTDDITPRLGLSLLQAGQAQKELTHNEALTLLDLLVQARVAAVGVDNPPAGPVPGACWILGAAPTRAWNGQAAGSLAVWTDDGWRFVPPFEGLCAWSDTDRMTVRFVDGAWRTGAINGESVSIRGMQVLGAQRPAIADPTGGAVVDVEMRAAMFAVLQALRDHGLIAT